MAYRIEFDPEAIQDMAKLKKSGNKAVIAKIEKLLLELMEPPATGTGQVEALKGNLSGYWSRRINKQFRIIYTIYEDIVTVMVISVKSHYGDK